MRKDCELSCGEVERRRKRKEGQKERTTPQDNTSLGQAGKFVIFLLLMAQNWLCVAAAEGLQKRTEMMERWQNQEVQVKESRWAEEITAERRRQN